MRFDKMLRRCPQCKRIFALKKHQTNIVRKDSIKILESLTQPHPKGEIQRMMDRYVPGERIFYEIVYVCRRCGAKSVEDMWRDVKV